MKSIITLAAAFSCASLFAQAVVTENNADAGAVAAENGAISSGEVAAINKEVKTHVAPSAKSIVGKDIDAYCQESGITLGVAKNGDTVYLKGVSNVLAPAQSPNFTRSRSAAYLKAYQNAVAEYVMDKFGKEVVEMETKYFSDRSSNRLQPSADTRNIAERIAAKAAQLTEAELDAKLRDLGVSASGSVAERRRLLTDAIVSTSMRKAIGSSAGLLPVQTFEGWNESGKYAVGVVVRGGLTTETVAECLRYKQRPMLTSPNGMTVAEAMPTDEELVSQFGVRMFFNEEGVPTLLSFGQWGSSYTGTDEDEAEDAMDHALRQAESIANEQLTTFINSTISIQESSEKSEEKINDAVFDENGAVSENKVTEYIDRISRNTKVQGEDTLIGRSTVCRKVITHPANGHQLAVCVRMWSFGQYDAMKRIIEKPKAPVVQPPTPAPATGTRGKRRGRSYDF